MPMFIKMGLHSTGYATHKCKKRNAQRLAGRRVVREGFPILTPFGSIDLAREYLSGDRITCLLCGKDYRVLGVHLRAIHRRTVDWYQETYHIPRRWGLACSDTKALHSANMDGKFAYGKISPGQHLDLAAAAPRRPYTWRRTKAVRSPSAVSKLAARRRADGIPEVGTPEYHQKMSLVAKERARRHPEIYRVQNSERARRMFTGRKQTPEQIAKRVAATQATKRAKAQGQK